MWILCCGMNRSGSTLQYQIVTKVAEFLPNVDIVGWVRPGQAHEVFGSATDSHDEWHIAKLHDYDEPTAAFCRKFHPKVIYIYRDLRDVVVSLMNMQGWDFDAPEIDSTIDLILLNYEGWTQVPGALVSRYEEVMAEGGLSAEVQRIAAYLGVQLSHQQVEQIAAAVSLPAAKRSIENFDYETNGLELPDFQLNTRLNPHTMLHDRHIHSGATEQWRTALTPVQVALLEVWTGEWLVARGYALAYSGEHEQLRMMRQAMQYLRYKSRQQAAQISGQRAYIHDLELRLQQQTDPQLEALRGRRIARMMAWLGRPLVK